MPAVRVSSAPAGQGASEEEGDGPAEGLVSSAGAQAASAARSRVALPSEVKVFRLTMPGSLEQLIPPPGCPSPLRDELPQFLLVKTFEELFAELQTKAAERTPGSSTVAALERGVHFIGKKVVEEAAESWMAAEYEGPERAAEEISQLLYQAQVLMIATGLELKDVYRHL